MATLIWVSALIVTAGDFIVIPLFFSSIYGFFLMLGLIPCVIYRIKIEEKMLIKKFGTEYMEYAKRTKKLIPHIY